MYKSKQIKWKVGQHIRGHKKKDGNDKQPFEGFQTIFSQAITPEQQAPTSASERKNNVLRSDHFLPSPTVLFIIILLFVLLLLSVLLLLFMLLYIRRLYEICGMLIV